MEEMTLCSPEHQEVFRRVWARVMGSEQEFSPDQSDRQESLEGDLPCGHLAELSLSTSPAVPPAAASEPECRDPRQLRRQVLEALEGWQCYRHLARRSQGGTAGILAAVASDQQRLARRLAAAYFLLTGVRYWPVSVLTAPAYSSRFAALRQRYQAEQAAHRAFLSAAQDSDHPDLSQLYRQLAAHCLNHCDQLRAVLERSSL